MSALPCAFVLLFACPIVFTSQANGQSVPATAKVDPHFYDYDAAAPFIATESPSHIENGIRISTVIYPSPVVTPFAVNNTVTAYLFLPPGPGPHPAMVVLHEWLPNDLKNEFGLCTAIAKNNIAAFLIVQPYSYVRRPMPRSADAELLSGNVPQMVGAMRQAILDCRRGTDWLTKRPDIDSSRMGVAGISLGGVLAGLLAGVDHRMGVVLTIVGGADVAEIMWRSPFTSKMRKELVLRGYNYETLKTALAPLEASNWLHDFNPKNALLFNGRYDIFITPNEAKDLAHALGDARIIWSNTGHYGIALSVKEADSTGAAFLQSRFFPNSTASLSGTSGPVLRPYSPPDTLPSPTIKAGFLFGGDEGISPAIAYQLFNFDDPGRYSIDGQLTYKGLSFALSGRIDSTKSIGLEFPILHGNTKPRPFFLLHFVL